MDTYSRNYVRNRQDCYRTLLERIPDPAFLSAFSGALGQFDASLEATDSVQELPETEATDPELKSLALDDLLKKQGIGVRLGKQVISVRDSLRLAEQIERVGLIWFQTLENKVVGDRSGLRKQAETHLLVLTRLLRLRDDLEFHRLKLTDS